MFALLTISHDRVDQLKQQKKEQALQANIKSFVSVNVSMHYSLQSVRINFILLLTLKADFLVRSHSVIKSKRKHIRGTHLMDEDMVW